MDEAVTRVVISAKDETGAVLAGLERNLGSVTRAIDGMGSMLDKLVGGLSVAAILSWSKGVIGAAASLDDLHRATGSSVESLSQYINQAKIAGISSDTASGLIYRMAAAMGGAGKGAAQAQEGLKLLGVTAKDPTTALQEVAKALDRYADGANKAALTRAIFQKSGPEFNAMLHDMAEAQTAVATTTTKQAEEADKLEKGLRRLQVESTALKNVLLSDVVPALLAVGTAMKTSGIAGLFGGLSVTPDDQKNLDAAIAKTKEDIEAVKRTLAAFEGNGAFVKFWSADDIAVANAQLATMTARLAALQGMVQANPERNIHMNADRYAAAAIKPDAPQLSGAATSAAAGVDEYAKALANVAKIAADAKLALEGLFAPNLLTRANKALNDLEASPAWSKISKADQERLRTLYGQAAAVELQTKKWEDLAKAAADFAAQQADERKKWDDALKQNAEQIDALVQKLGLETETMFMTNDERERAIALAGILYKSEADYEAQVKRVNEAFNARNGAAALKQQLEKQAEEWKKAYDGISNTITDALMRGFEGGKDWAQNFLQTLKNMFSTLVLRPIIQAIVAPVAGGLTGLIPGSASASSGAGSFGGLSNLTSLFGGGGLSFGTALENLGTIMPTFSTMLESGATMAESLSAAFSGMGSSIATVAGPIGLAIGGAFLVKSFLDKKKGGPKEGGAGATADFGSFGISPSWMYPGETTAAGNSSALTLATSTLADYNRILALVGGTGTAQFLSSFSTDPKGKALSTVSQAATVNGRLVYASTDNKAGRDDATLQAELKNQAKHALLAALQASELPADIARVLDAVAAMSATSDQIDKLFSLATAVQSINTALDSLGDVNATLDKLANPTAMDAFRDQGIALDKLIDTYDGSVAATDALASASGSYYNALVTLLAQLRQATSQVDSTVAGGKETINTAGRSNDWMYAYLQSDAQRQFDSIASLTDPAKIAAAVSKASEDSVKAFGLLSPADQELQRQNFLDGLDTLNRTADDRLKALGDVAISSFKSDMADVKTLLMGVADDMKKAGADQVTAGGMMLTAAATPVKVDVEVTTTGGGEIGGG